MSSAFSLQHEPLSVSHPVWGSAAVIPWDSEIFGFPVAQMELGDAGAVAKDEAAFKAALTSWSRERSVRLVSCRVAEAGNSRAAGNIWPPLLCRLGWSFVEYSMLVQIPDLQRMVLPPTEVELRAASPVPPLDGKRSGR
jgi:hypothetical protein